MNPTGSPPAARRGRVGDYALALAAVAACTAAASLLHGRLERANLIMIYLVGVTAVAARCGRGPAVVTSVLSVAAFDFFFVRPFYSLAVADTQYLLTFAVMLLVALVISTMAVSLQRQTSSSRAREARTAALYRLSRELSGLRGTRELLGAALRNLREVLDSRAAVLLPDSANRLVLAEGDPDVLDAEGRESSVAEWSFRHGRPAGLGTGVLPDAAATHLPLAGSRGPVGMLVVRPAEPGTRPGPEQLRLLETFGNQMALAIERAQLADQSEAARVRTEADRLRSTLLSSVSHDLRTPLASITGATSSLLDDEDTLDAETRHDLVATISEESMRLNRLVGNLLDMTRLESGILQPSEEWHSLEEVVGAALERLDGRLKGRAIRVDLPRDLPLIPLDDVLIEQVMFNLVDNALKYTPAATPVEIRARLDHGCCEVEVADHGPGLNPGSEERVFEKFYREKRSTDPGGVGLGLAICRGIVEAHGGHIGASGCAGGGASFRFTLPLGDGPPPIEAEPADPSPAYKETRG